MNIDVIHTKYILVASAFLIFDADATAIAPLPEPVTNNAVTLVKTEDSQYIVSFSGLGKKKDHTDVHNKTFVYDIKHNHWKRGSNVPIQDPILDKGNNAIALKGRLASVATSVGKYAYLFGGYTVASNHEEVSVPDVYNYDVEHDTFNRLAPMPIPVDDSIALPYQDNFIYLVSGWHNDGNVNLVQMYDIKKNTWTQATPFPGSPVFGQAGAILGDTMLVCDGVKTTFHRDKKRTYTAEPACYQGKIDNQQPNKIDWRVIPHPTGTARYRMAANSDTKNHQFIFVGGSDNPYNYNGIGYNKVPSSPDNKIWHYDLNKQAWTLTLSLNLTMDHRGLIILNNQLLTVGGMGKDQKVLNTVTLHTVIKHENE